MTDIFISYASQDKARIKTLAEALGAEGWTVFWDRTIKPGENWHKVIGQELKTSRCVVVAWSKALIESDWVFEEAVAGKQRNALIALNLDVVEIPFGFGQLQSADLKEWDGTPVSAEFRELIAAITSKIGPPSKNADGFNRVKPSKTEIVPAESIAQEEETAKHPIEAVHESPIAQDQPAVPEAPMPVLARSEVQKPLAQPTLVSTVSQQAAYPPLEAFPVSPTLENQLAEPKVLIPASAQSEVREHPARPSPADAVPKADETIPPPPANPRPMRKTLVWIGVLSGLVGVGTVLNTQLGKVGETSSSHASARTEQAQAPVEPVKGQATPVIEPEMVRIEPGQFQMGSKVYSNEGPVHLVKITKPFAIGRYEVTFEPYDQYAQAEGKPLPKDEGWGRGNRPVINISWDEAVAYADWLSGKTGKHYRLPTEAEWEYAARAGTQTNYWWGNEIGQGRANCSGCGSQWDGKQTAPVGSFPANAWGLHDTAGNVWEWVMDGFHESYQGAPTDGHAWVVEYGPYMMRGGAWNDDPLYLRCANRLSYHGSDTFNDRGFRLSQDL